MGGVPRDPKVVEGWLRSKAGISDEEEIRAALLRTMTELGAEVAPDMSFADLEAAADKLAGVRETNGFKQGEHGLYIEQRQVKAALKESTNVLFAGDKWGPTRKGPKSFLAERVFVEPDHILLGREEPDGVEMVVGHIIDRNGPRSTLGYHQYVRRATITFDVLAARDAIQEDWWQDLWVHMQENGIGALRSQGYGKFDIVAWDKLPATPD